MCKEKDAKGEGVERLLRFLGLARRAGKVVMGTDLVCHACRDRKMPFLVLLASGISPATEKKVRDKCGFYSLPIEKISASADELGEALGKLGSIAAVAITDAHFASELVRLNTVGKEPPKDEGEGN